MRGGRSAGGHDRKPHHRIGSRSPVRAGAVPDTGRVSSMRRGTCPSLLKMADVPSKPKKKKFKLSTAWYQAKDLIWPSRWRLLLGLVLMLVTTAAGFVMPYLSKSFIDD